MTERIDFETKTDRELLVLVAQLTNTINEDRLPAVVRRLNELNTIVDEHSARLVRIETNFKPNSAFSQRRVTAIVAGIITGVISSIYFLGNCLGWW